MLLLPNRCHDTGMILAFGVFMPYFSGIILFPLHRFRPKLNKFVWEICVVVSQLYILLCIIMPTDAKLSFSYRHDNKSQRLIEEYVPGGLLLIWYYSADWGGCQGGILFI